ncbi:MFS transporter [Antricoccus suffuscus]|uniref:MFS transporter n=1 Tax=Antricoccus suffuscus TaxID=1629062 RepID=A0A2T0ZB31_9ACTN|nr:MFS transporter [Antricoccus suffuscus]PRZ33560.1 MFS transporter [Antricoccus suffuscus]
MANARVVNDAVGTRRQQTLLCLALFAIAYSAQTVSPVMLFYTVDLKLSTTTLTLFFTVYAIGLMIAFLIGGPQSDKRGRKAVVVPSMGLLLLAIIALLGAAAWGEPMILIARFVQGVASGAVFTVGTVWLRELAGTKHAAGAAMRASGVMAFGFAVGPFVAGILVQWLPLPRILSFVIALIAVVAAIAIARSLPETMTEHRPGRIQIGLPKGTVTGFLCYLVPCGLLVYTFAMLSLVAFPIQLGEAGFVQIYFILGVSALLVQGFAALATIWAKRLGPGNAGWMAGLCGAAGCALGYLAVQPGGWPWVLPASVVIGLAGGLSMTSGVTVADLLAPPERRGALISMFYIVVYIGYSSPTVLSLIWGKQTMERGSTIVGLGIAAAVIMLILAIPGRSILGRRAVSAANAAETR